MQDEVNQLETERLERVEAVNAARLEADRKRAEKREADKLRKRAERAIEKQIKDAKKNARASDERMKLKHLENEQAGRDAHRIVSERKALLLQELQPECLAEPDSELSDDDGPTIPSWKAYVQNELDLYLLPLEKLDFETMYWKLALSEVGVLVLKNVLNVPLPSALPDGWQYVNICDEIKAARPGRYPQPRFDLWEFETTEQLLKKAEAWDRLHSSGNTRQSPNTSIQMQSTLDVQLADIARRKQVYRDKLEALRTTYVNARRQQRENFKEPELKTDPVAPPQAPKPELLSEPQQPRFGGFFESKRSDWPITE